ncbi:MAG TPA: DUF6516 family protein [Eoetvoesiella sp.]|uniref:toxin-antitoxin system TumE family protein n=1 Tax=Eoetvoesiella sp. TaxID=1966355 RepID=UPI002BAC5B58|nr:DUF6516 family protein [Eoetvoesiella sp.]HWK61449.1 DUF6516 family protein [Eoetvoesiella sp.]
MTKAKQLLRQRHNLSATGLVDIVIWEVPASLPGSNHSLKYRLAFVVEGVCVLRYDNEAGKGDHKHIGNSEVPYHFIDMDKLLDDFWCDVENWSRKL